MVVPTGYGSFSGLQNEIVTEEDFERECKVYFDTRQKTINLCKVFFCGILFGVAAFNVYWVVRKPETLGVLIGVISALALTCCWCCVRNKNDVDTSDKLIHWAKTHKSEAGRLFLIKMNVEVDSIEGIETGSTSVL